ncbi:acyltransferase family protein [soil metagenome]
MTEAAVNPPARGAYRPDIDGLRALAILPVVFYHFKVPGFGGGFVGVDIFFVISGYLITQVLTDPARPLGLATFYARRIRRLAPALFVLTLAVIAASLILTQPMALIGFGESLVSLAAGASNIYFWKALAAYFTASAESRPLLHTWSLAVEEQFYLLFPIFLTVAGRLGKSWRLIGIALAGLASLALAAWFAPRAPSASFYLAPTRAWELLAGAGLALRPASWTWPRAAAAEGLAGLILIAFSVFDFGPDSQVPGLAALIPVLGAVLLIHAGEATSLNPVSRLLSIKPFVFIGMISYALYLWHWPIYVFVRREIGDALSPAVALAAIAASFVMAILSWRLIERPIRQGALIGTTPRAFAAAALISLTLAGAGAAILTDHGWPGRFPGAAAFALQPGEQHLESRVIGRKSGSSSADGWLIQNPDPAARRVLVWGDSFAGHLAPGLRQLGPSSPLSVYVHTRTACPPVIDYDPMSDGGCRPHNRQALALIKAQHVDTVILSAYWQSYTTSGKLKLERLTETVAQLRRLGINTIVVGQSPLYAFDAPDEYHYRQVRKGGARNEGWATNQTDLRLNPALHAAVGGVFFDPTPLFCQGPRCQYRAQCLYLVRDSGHLTAFGSARLVGALLKTPALQAKTP